MEGWSLKAEAPALSDFYSFQKQKKRIFRQLVLNNCKLFWRAIKAFVVGCLLILAHSRKKSNAFEDARF